MVLSRCCCGRICWRSTRTIRPDAEDDQGRARERMSPMKKKKAFVVPWTEGTCPFSGRRRRTGRRWGDDRGGDGPGDGPGGVAEYLPRSAADLHETGPHAGGDGAAQGEQADRMDGGNNHGAQLLGKRAYIRRRPRAGSCGCSPPGRWPRRRRCRNSIGRRSSAVSSALWRRFPRPSIRVRCASSGAAASCGRWVRPWPRTGCRCRCTRIGKGQTIARMRIPAWHPCLPGGCPR